MSTREWKPGEIVVGLLDGNEIVGIVRGGGKRMFYADSVTTDQVDLKHVRNLRPLVVIDPDSNDVERLQDLYLAAEAKGLSGLSMQAALREFANPTPPKPAEPTGLGAVVEDAGGERWIRAARIAHGWHRPMGKWAAYAEINAVRVLSEGVTQ